MNRKLHVMHILLSLETGGCENGIVNLINNMDTDKFKVSVCCLDKIGELAERIHERRRNVVLVKKNGRPGIIDILRLSKLFYREGVNIVHTHGWGTVAMGYLSAKLAGVPVVIHGEHGSLHVENRRRIFAQKILFRLVDCTVTVSKDLQSRLASVFNVDKRLFYPIINGVDSSRFIEKNPTSKAIIRNQLGIDENGCLIGSVGRLVEWKRHDVLINAAENLVKRGNNVFLMIVGDGPLKESLQALIDNKGLKNRLFLVGRRENVSDYLSAMDIFALTSSSSTPDQSSSVTNGTLQLPVEFEGVSNALLEAMACGLPVVATNVGGTPEIVEDTHTGYLFEPGNADLLINTLSMLVMDKDLRIKVGNSARKSIVDKFDLSTMVRGYEELYLNLARKKSVI